MTSEVPAELVAELLHLELTLMDPALRHDPDKVSALLASEFREFGSSGRNWSRAEIVEMMAHEIGYAPPLVLDFNASMLADNTVLVTYRTCRDQQDEPAQGTLRSSIWVYRDQRWQVLFHQGTKIPQSSSAAS